MKRQFLIIVFLLSSFLVLHAQTDTYKFKVVIEGKRRNAIKIVKKDSLLITFLYGYRNDVISIQTNQKTFKSDTLNADNLYGIGGSLKIAKRELKEPFGIYFNGKLISILSLKKKYSRVLLEFTRDNNRFTWRYLKYKFSFL